jgi:glucose/mannose-6-phosphate isomerase
LPTLDDVATIRALDPGNMYNRIFDFPEQMADALKIADGWKIQASEFSGIKNIVLIGMGGSAIGGDLVRTYLSDRLMIPFQICRNYVVPEYVDDETLVIVSSYSGNTEETLAALDDALGRKALMVALTTGGILEEVAKFNEIPTAILPAGLQPRAALGYSFVPVLVLMEKIGLVKGVVKEITTAVRELEVRREDFIEDNPTKANPAKNIAEKLLGKIAIVYGGPTMTDVVAVRWKGQLCENSKNLTFANAFPEFNHNELVAWCDVAKPHADKLAVVILRDEEDLGKIARRMDIVKGIIEKAGILVIEVTSTGSHRLSRMLSLVQVGDFVSYYLAVLNKVDPTPVAAIETLKKSLAE